MLTVFLTAVLVLMLLGENYKEAKSLR